MGINNQLGMPRAELAARLIDSGDVECETLLAENSVLADVELAYELKEICWEAWTVEPTRSIKAASALEALAKLNNEKEIAALADWVRGIAAIVQGQMENAIAQLDRANAGFRSIGKDNEAAATQVSKLIALSLLGRYDEAIECGLRAREIFLAHNDLLAAGKAEHNIGNLFFRRDRYREAEQFQSAAREKFTVVRNQRQLATINNCLANTRALLHKFDSAEALYDEAMSQAERANLPVTLAEIEGNIGTFALLQGKYDRALDYLERSRRRYASLGMALQSATAEHEIADAYLELNLTREAAQIYERIIRTFHDLGMRAEEARASAYAGRAAVAAGNVEQADSLFERARVLYSAEGNEVGAAVVSLAQAQLNITQRQYQQAAWLAAEAKHAFVEAGSWQKLLLARYIEAEAVRAQGDDTKAEQLLNTVLADATQYDQPQISERCYTSLGLVAVKRGDPKSGEQHFRKAIELVERLRAPLPGEEFRSSFFADRLVPYNELTRLCLDAGRLQDAFHFVEAARSRTLVDMVAGSIRLHSQPHDEFESRLFARVESLTAELNYVYNQINRSVRGQAMPGREQMVQLQQEQHDLERELLDISRQLQHRDPVLQTQHDAFDVSALQKSLDDATAIIEYATVDEELIAFVLTSVDLKIFRQLVTSAEISRDVEQFRFQIDALRYGSEQIRTRLPLLTKRINKHLSSLYDKLLRPLESTIREHHIVIVPQGELHYLPFHALHDGEAYVIERREVSYAASASVLQQNLRHTVPTFNTAAIFGVADEAIPRVREEVAMVATAFADARVFQDETASMATLRNQAGSVDILHLACHAHFRPDSPLFSSLRLGDGWLTAREASRLRFGGGLITLSACETGVNSLAPGDELIGLARGFFAAGAPSLLLTLWMVDDEAAAKLMTEFYLELQQTNSPSKALRAAQLKALRLQPHPFFWSPFALVGRW